MNDAAVIVGYLISLTLINITFIVVIIRMAKERLDFAKDIANWAMSLANSAIQGTQYYGDEVTDESEGGE